MAPKVSAVTAPARGATFEKGTIIVRQPFTIRALPLPEPGR